MTDYTAATPPPLPLDALREALGNGNLEQAAALVDAHDRAVRHALPPDEAGLLDPRQRQAWLSLLEHQAAMIEELAVLRDRTGDQLRQLQRQHRGTSAYLQAMG